MTGTRTSELKRLLDAALDIAAIKDTDKRHQGGFWLQGQCESFASQYTLSVDEEADFMVVGWILMNVIFSDAVEDTHDLAQTLAIPTKRDQAIIQAQKIALERNG